MKTWVLTLGLVVLCTACGKTVAGTETGNPPVISPSLVSVEAAGADTVMVTGSEGAVTPGGGEVSITNVSEDGESTVADVGSDGSFSAELAGLPADDYTLVASNEHGSSTPQMLSPDPGSNDGNNADTGNSDWQSLHMCVESDPVDPLGIADLRIEGDTLHVNVSHAGGCAEHSYGLCYSGDWAESFPIQVGFMILHDAMGDPCEALESADISFDLAPFKEAYKQAYRTESGAAQLGFDSCTREDGSRGGCNVLYGWGDDDRRDGGDDVQSDGDDRDDLPAGAGDDIVVSTAPEDWAEHSTGCGFSFRGPDDLTEQEIQPVDSCVVQFTNDSCSLNADYGWYSGSFDWLESEAEYSDTETTIDGRNAKLFSAMVDDDEEPYLAGVHFPQVSDEDPATKLTMSISCKNREARDAMLPALSTIRFGR